MTHKDYFREYKISIEQYGVLLVALAFDGKNTQHGNKGFDIYDAKISDNPCRIEVKSKITQSLTGKATVIHCNDNKFNKKGMTHLAVVLINPDSYEVAEAWLITKNKVRTLRSKTESKYIPVKKVREHKGKGKIDITRKLKEISLKSILRQPSINFKKKRRMKQLMGTSKN